MTKSINKAQEYLSKMSDEEFTSALQEVGFDVEYAEEEEGGRIILCEDNNADKDDNANKDINPAIAYSIVKDMIANKEDTESLQAWDYLYNLCREECTHTHIDGSPSWVYPYEHVDYKFCEYCSWN